MRLDNRWLFNSLEESKKFLLLASEKKVSVAMYLIFNRYFLIGRWFSWTKHCFPVNTSIVPNYIPNSALPVLGDCTSCKLEGHCHIPSKSSFLNISSLSSYSSNDRMSRSLTHKVALPSSLEMLYWELNSIFHVCSNQHTGYNGNST